MAGSLNKVCLIGRLGKDPETRNLSNGGKVVNLRLATSERYKDRDGQQQERTEWHTVVVFNERLGEIAEKFLRKGGQAYVEGQLQTRKWSKDGEDRYSTEVVLTKFGGALVLLGGKQDNPDAEPSAPRGDWRGDTGGGGTKKLPPKGGDPFMDDEVPF